MTKPPFRKFSAWRPYQEELVKAILNSDKPVNLLQAPTGTGKTLVAMSAGSESEAMNYVVATKQLQEQITRDFSEVKVLKGRNNYTCNRLGYPITADLCPGPCDGPCDYKQHKKQVLASQYRVLNYSYFLNEANWVGRFSNVPFLVLDECDAMESELMSFVEFRVSERYLEKFDIEPPRYKTKYEAWIDWAGVLVPKVDKLIEQNAYVFSEDSPDPQVLRYAKGLESFKRKLEFFIDYVDEDWVYDDRGSTWTFKPLWISPFTFQYLLSHADKILMMSATVLNPKQFCKNLGIPFEDVAYFEAPSQFPIKNRPIYYRPVGDVTYKTKGEVLPKIAEAVEEILTKHRDVKGIIHAVSYEIARYLLKHLGTDRLVSHDTKNRHIVLERFKQSKEPLVLISPSMERGVDLPYDTCRFIVLPKTPWPDLSDKQTSKRVYSSRFGQKWYRWQTVANIVQACGRGMRSEDDYCVTYILDSQFGKLLRQNTSYFPTWWREALVL